MRESVWTSADTAAAESAARAAELALRRGLHPERDPFALTVQELRRAPELAQMREWFRRAHAEACRRADDGDAPQA